MKGRQAIWQRIMAVLSAVLVLLVLVLLAMAPRSVGQASTTTSWDAAVDFSAVSNPNGAWGYGWSTSRGSAFDKDAVTSTDHGLNVWTNSSSGPSDVFYNGTSNSINPAGTNPIPPGTLAFHPGATGQNAIVRWTAPSTGVYYVAATFTGRDSVGPTTTDVAVLKNGGPQNGGEQLWADNVSGYLATKNFSDQNRSLNAGDTIDFTVGYGTNGNNSYDSTGLSAQVSLIDSIPTNTPTDIPTNTPTDIPTNTPTDIPTNTPTSTPTNTPTDTPTSAPTNTPTSTPTNTPTSIPTNTPTNTPTVVYRFDGFLQPVNDTTHTLTCGSPCPMSVFKAGSTVPVKFQLRDASGAVVQASSLPLFSVTSPATCGAGAVDESTSTAAPDSSTTYRWDSTGQQYIYNYKSPAKTGQCVVISAKLDDGTTHSLTIGYK